jgi:hypothetical protein
MFANIFALKSKARATVAAGLLVLSSFQAMALDRSFRVINDSNNVVYAVYATDIDRGDWGRDLLHNSVVHPGGSAIVEPHHRGYCRFDIKIVFNRADGPEQVIRNVNVCDLLDVTTFGYRNLRVPYLLNYI